MKDTFNIKKAALFAILSLALVAPAWAQGQKPEHPQAQTPIEGMEKAKGPEQGQAVGEKVMGDQFKQRRIAMIKGLKLAPDKEKAVLAVEEKYVQQRRATINNLKQAHTDLETALAAPTPDEGKIKGLVNMLTSGMDAVFNSFKSQRDEELALMSPIEQGKYLIALGKFRQEMMGKKPPAGKKKK